MGKNKTLFLILREVIGFLSMGCIFVTIDFVDKYDFSIYSIITILILGFVFFITNNNQPLSIKILLNALIVGLGTLYLVDHLVFKGKGEGTQYYIYFVLSIASIVIFPLISIYFNLLLNLTNVKIELKRPYWDNIVVCNIKFITNKIFRGGLIGICPFIVMIVISFLSLPILYLLFFEGAILGGLLTWSNLKDI